MESMRRRDLTYMEQLMYPLTDVEKSKKIIEYGVGGRKLHCPVENYFLTLERDANLPSYDEGPAQFASRRRGTDRLHAGVDLYSPVGTRVTAIWNGKIVRTPYLFFAGSYAVDIWHGEIGLYVRYCEISVNARDMLRLRLYSDIKAGDKLGTVSRLEGIQSSMLHLEVYDTPGPKFATKVEPFRRSGSLLDPTPLMRLIENQWRDAK